MILDHIDIRTFTSNLLDLTNLNKKTFVFSRLNHNLVPVFYNIFGEPVRVYFQVYRTTIDKLELSMKIIGSHNMVTYENTFIITKDFIDFEIHDFGVMFPVYLRQK